MKYGRTFNFSAGPAMMPEPVLEEIRDEVTGLLDHQEISLEQDAASYIYHQ